MSTQLFVLGTLLADANIIHFFVNLEVHCIFAYCYSQQLRCIAILFMCVMTFPSISMIIVNLILIIIIYEKFFLASCVEGEA